MEINRADFARDCVDAAFQYGVDPQYLIALGQLLSGIDDNTVGGRVGPFRITQTEWDSNKSDPMFQTSFESRHINRPGLQCIYAAVMTDHAQTKLAGRLNRLPSPIELYKEWPNIKIPTPAGKTDEQALIDAWQAALDATKDLVEPAAKAALAGLNVGNLVGPINLDFLNDKQKQAAQKIIDGFKAAGCTVVAQAAALANAMGESRLNPDMVNNTPPEHSVGLFQCNINGGVGDGKTEEFLKVPENNIALILAEVEKRAPQFKSASDLKAAVGLFVKEVERPKNPEKDTAIRMGFAGKFLPQ